MVDWDLVAKIAGGGYASCILVLGILSFVVWLIGTGVQRWGPSHEEKEQSK